MTVPKKVDHRERRTEIADALMRIAADRGLEAVSLRHVATEAGVSTGMVQHYFRTKDEMMAFALDVVSDRIQARAEASIDSAASPKDIVRALLIQLLPLDKTRQLEGHVGLAFLAYSAVKPAMATRLRESAVEMRVVLADMIRAAQRSTNLDPDQAAVALFALVDGLGVQILGHQESPDVALAAFDAHLDLLFA